MLEETVYLGLGSNLGDRVAHLCAGLERLQERGLRLLDVSSFWVTEPDWGSPAGGAGGADRTIDAEERDHPIPQARSPCSPEAGHPWYVNCVAGFDRAPSPRRLLELCLEVERSEGRERPPNPPPGARPVPRTLDIDVLLIGDSVIDEPGLTVPHPRLGERRFVLRPLEEIAPQARHPVTGETVRQMLASLPAGPKVELLQPQPDGTFVKVSC